jgi:hypothetical protein
MDLMFVDDVLGLSVVALLVGLSVAAVIGLAVAYGLSKAIMEDLND